MKTIKLKTVAGAAFLGVALLLWAFGARAQGIPGQSMVPLGYCQLSASQLASASALSKCVRASFTASAGSPANQLVVTSVSGIILPGDQVVSGVGIPTASIIVSQVSGTPGGAGTYLLNANNTASAASVTSGGIPPGATMALLQSEVADVRYRDDGASPTTALGVVVTHATPGILYTGTLSKLQFIAASGSPLLDAAFYR